MDASAVEEQTCGMTSSLAKKNVLYLLGSFILILGITLILAWWPDVVGLFRGMIGMLLAVGGLVILYSLQR